MNYYDLHGIATVGTDLDLTIPDYFATTDQRGCDVVVKERRLPKPTEPTKRCGAFSYSTWDGTLHVDYKLPVGTARFALMDVDSRPHLMFTPSMAEHGDVHRLARTLYRVACIQRGWPLVHAGALVDDEGAVLVTAPPDSGKTSTVLSQLDGDRFRFMADDHLFVSREGMARSYPRPVNLSPFTLTGEAIDRSDGPVQSVKRRLAASRLELGVAKLGVEMGERRTVPPNLIVDEAPIHAVVAITSGRGAADRIDPDDAARHIVTSTMDEFAPFAHYAVPLYCHEFGLDPFAWLDGLRDTVAEAVADAECYALRATDVEEYPGLFDEVIR